MPSDQSERFPRRKRILKRTEFQRAYRHGIRVAGRHMVFFALKTDGEGRLGVTASRKIGNAVVRSRCRRRLRELYRLHQWQHPLPIVDLVVNARHSCPSASWAALETDFDRCLGRLSDMIRSGRGRAGTE